MNKYYYPLTADILHLLQDWETPSPASSSFPGEVWFLFVHPPPAASLLPRPVSSPPPHLADTALSANQSKYHNASFTITEKALTMAFSWLRAPHKGRALSTVSKSRHCQIVIFASASQFEIYSPFSSVLIRS